MTMQVSNLGRVRSSRGVVHCGHVRDGYHCVSFKKRMYSVHVLVARTFLGPPPSDAHTVDHIDMNPSNNAVTNLRWATRSQQTLYSYQLNAARSKAVDKRATRIEARKVQNAGSEWEVFESCNEAARKLGTSQGNIGSCLNGKRKTALGYEFRRVDDPEDDNEMWVGVDGIHVSDSGRVRTARGHVHCGSGGKTKTYLSVAAGGTRKYVHVLVARGFLGPRPSAQHTVDHINNNPRDNRVVNLRWATPQEQVRHSFDSNTTRGNHIGKQSKPVRVRSESNSEWVEYSGVNEAVRCTGCNVASVHRALREGVASNGLYFEYVPFVDIPNEVWRCASV